MLSRLNLLIGNGILVSQAPSFLPTNGVFSKYSNIVAIVLIIAGLGIIHFSIKSLKGFKFLPQTEVVVVDKTKDYVDMEAAIADDREYDIPNFSKTGEANTKFHELLIKYTYDGEEFSHWIPFEVHDGSIMLKINPKNPKDFYIDRNGNDFEGIPDENGNFNSNELDDYDDDELENQYEDSDSAEEVSKMGVVGIIIGVLIAGVGAGLLIDYFIK